MIGIVAGFCSTGVIAAEKNDYSDGRAWLCRPGRTDACTIDLNTTIVAADGALTREEFKPLANPPIDCFYVYPTVSSDPSANSDMNIDPAERGVVRSQFARFGAACRLFAPMYRQVTLAALRARLSGGPPMTPDRELALQRRPRRVELLPAARQQRPRRRAHRALPGIRCPDAAHSQRDRRQAGAGAADFRAAPWDQPVGAERQGRGRRVSEIPLCHSATDTGCAIAYASFRSTIPPPENSLFGRIAGDNTMQAACSNPAALAGGSGALHAYLSTGGSSITGSAAQPKPWVTPAKTIDTPFVSVPGLLTAQCVSNEKGSYLEVTVHGNPADPRTDEITGDVMQNGQPNAGWGLHLIDVNLAMGNLVDVVRSQGKAYLAERRRASSGQGGS